MRVFCYFVKFTHIGDEYMNTAETPPSVSLLPDERLDRINENLSLIQKTDGLTFGTDAYLLAAFAKAAPALAVADLGSGTGVAALLCMARKKYRHAYAVELQTEFCELISRNAALNQMDGAVTVIRKDVRELTMADIGVDIGAVISNPPYMPAGAGIACADNRLETARRELNGTIGDFCLAAARLLQTGGLFYTVFRPERMADLFCALRGARLEPKRLITVYPDTESRPCLILTEAKKDAAPSLMQAPPLIIYKSRTDRTYTDNMARIYDTFSVDFLFDKH